jgi:alpha-beta hydrolase superfamily lysophospholipase
MFNYSSVKHKWMNKFFFARFNKKIKDPHTKFDWLSTNESEVRKYITDPLCGYNMSLDFYENLLKGSLKLHRLEKEMKFRKSIPVLIISGKDDPVGNFGRDPEKLYKIFQKQSFLNVEMALFDGRHELLNEQPAIVEKFYEKVSDFIESAC